MSSLPHKVTGRSSVKRFHRAATSVWAGVVAPADEVGGRYCENCHVGNIVPDDVTITAASEGVRVYALNPTTAEALWKKSEELVGQRF